MLHQLLKKNPRGFIMIWDGASAHRSKTTRAFLQKHPQITVERLPAYAPELNPEEYSHGNVKAHNRNVIPQSKAHLREMLNSGFRRLRKRPDLLLSFFQHAGLTVRQLWRS
jgi:transposase